MKMALKETWRIVLRTLPWMLLYEVIMLVALPDVRVYVLEHMWNFHSGMLGMIAVFYVLIFAAQLVLVWVRAEKKEEEKA